MPSIMATKRLQGLSMRELTRRTGVGRASIYGWARAGLLPQPGRGRGARYDEAFVARVERIRDLRREHHYLDAVAAELAKPLPAPVVPVPPAVTPSVPSEKWERLTLLPGLEVSYRADGGPVLRRLAEEIWTQFAGRT